MFRSALSKVMWVGRATVFVVGLSVILAVVLGVASMALGADGDFFKVGRTNLADSVSRLTKSGAGPALDLRVDSGPPLAVNRQAKVANLNADELDGLSSNELVRSGLGARNDFGSNVTFTSQTSVTVNAPRKGFVIANGAVMVDTSSSSCNPCYAHVEIFNSTTNERSLVLVDSLGNGTTTLRDDVLSTTWVFPVDPGNNTFRLRTGPVPAGAPINFSNPRLSAVYVPYGATGTSKLGSSNELASPRSGAGETLENGAIRRH